MHISFFCVQTVQKRGAEVIKARKLSSAMSAAKATADHMHDWWFGTQGVSCVFSPFFFFLGGGRSRTLHSVVLFKLTFCLSI